MRSQIYNDGRLSSGGKYRNRVMMAVSESSPAASKPDTNSTGSKEKGNDSSQSATTGGSTASTGSSVSDLVKMEH